ncbi:MAG: prolyl oligopeptidase family serine peptidase, partial [Phycisphaerae bacterium]
MAGRTTVSTRLILLTLILFGFNSSARAGEEVFTSRHLLRIHSVGSALISPDGSHIAYTRFIPRDPYRARGKQEPEFEDGGSRTELHLMHLADDVSIPFIGRYAPFSGVAWTPDGEGLSFLAKRGKDKHKSLYVISLHGGEARRILAHETDIAGYDWSPDGRHVAFLSREKAPKQRDKMKKMGLAAEIFEEQLLFTRLWIADFENGDAEPRMLELEGDVSELHWSPAGDRIVIALAPTPLIDDHYMKRKIHVVDVKSGQVVAIIGNPGKLGPVAWSPDGKNLAIISADDLNDPSPGRLAVCPAAGGPPRDLIPDYEGHVRSIAWQDADTILYVADEGCDTVFGKVNIDGSGRKTIVPAGGPILTSLSVSKDGLHSAFVGNTTTHSREVYFMKHGDAAPRRMTDSNPWFADMRFAKQEIVNYKARDGLELQGILIHPLDEEPSKRYPLIVTVHGGPEANEHNGWQTRYSKGGQIAAAKGFAVFYPNYRGSTGRGVAFSKLDQADYAAGEFNDIVDGVNHLVERGLVDKDHVGVTGGSYGGFAAAWCATALTEHFAASVMFVGISDHVSKFGTTDIPNEMFL